MATVYRNRQLMYLSVILFFYFASIGCLAPFLTSHMRHLGFSLSEISFLNAASAFCCLLGPVLWGTFAERKNRYRSTTAFCMALGAVAFVALAFVPRYQKLHYRPLVDFDCKEGLRVERCVNWANCGEALGGGVGDAPTRIRLADCHYRCPGGGPYPLHLCFHGESGNICVVFDADSRNDSSLAEFDSPLQEWPWVEVPPTANSTAEDVHRVAMCNHLPQLPITFNKKEYQSISCRPARPECGIQCKVALTGGVSVRQCEEASGDPSTTFWSYLVLRSIADLCMLSAVCLLDAVTVWSTADYEGSYGRIHVWAALGAAALAPLSGALIDHYADGAMHFVPSAILAAIFAIIAAVLVAALPIHRQKSSQFQQAVMPSKESHFFSCELLVLAVVVLVLGMQWSVLFVFLPWMTADIGCSATQTGMATALLFGFAAPFLLISKNMVRNIGKANLIVFAFLFYFTRYAGITFVTSPWWTLPFALMGSFSLCVAWVAVVAYGQKLAPPGYSLIMQYMLNLLHFGFGRGLGSLAGGALISVFSQRVVFCGIGVFSAVIAFFYLTIYHIGIRKKNSSYPVILNTSWYPLQTRYPNGDAKAHQPIVGDQDDDVDSPRNGRHHK